MRLLMLHLLEAKGREDVFQRFIQLHLGWQL